MIKVHSSFSQSSVYLNMNSVINLQLVSEAYCRDWLLVV